MPFTIADVEKHNKGLSPTKKRQWVEVANSVMQRCMSNGGSDATCAPSAIRQANGVVAAHSQYQINTTNENYQVREVIHQGKKHLIVPVVMMVEGVHHGSRGQLLHTAQELGHFIQSWNGIPVVIDHPQDEEGNYISANEPSVMESTVVGKIFNAHMNGSRLIAEAWIEEDKIRNVSPVTLASIESREIVEVSVGVFSDEEQVTGEWNGEEYTAIARNHRPDHLALLPGGVGACSVDDGCGMGVNKKGGKTSMENNATVTGMEAKRQELGMTVAEFYAVPRDPPSESKLPIFDAAHVRNALARFTQTQGLSEEEKATAKRKILARARHFNIDASSLENNARENLFEVLRSAKEVGLYAGSLELNVDQSLSERVDMIRRKVDTLDTNDSVHYVQDIYDDFVVYEARLRVGGTRLFKQTYSINNGQVEFTGNPIPVVKKVEYVTAQSSKKVTRTIFNNNNKEVQMANEKCTACVEKKVNDLISNSQGKWTDGDKEWLQSLEEAQLDRIIANSKVDAAPAPAVNEQPKLKSEDVLNALSAEQRAALQYGQEQLKQRRDNFIKGIQANTSKEEWPDDVLSTFDDKTLERIFNTSKKNVKEAEVVDYSVRGFGNFSTNAADTDEEPLYPTGFEMK